MVTEEREVEVTVISAKDLKKVKKFGGEQKCYAVAYIYLTQKQATAVDKRGGVNPTWNTMLNLTCFESHLHPPSASLYALTVDIYSHGSFLGPKLLGSATLPLHDLTATANASLKDQQPYMALFQVRRPSGKAKGVLNISVRLASKRPVDLGNNPELPSYDSFHANVPRQRSSTTNFAQGDVVTGYPASKPAGEYPVPTAPFAPLGSLPRRQVNPQRPSTSSRAERRMSMERQRNRRAGGSKKKRSKMSVGLMILAGTVLAIILI